ncbi:MAG: hypothetical protein DWB56_12150 [Candidatus Jettenia sp.]|nr:hypothetical protein [Candidatus Jettenia sp.]
MLGGWGQKNLQHPIFPTSQLPPFSPSVSIRVHPWLKMQTSMLFITGLFESIHEKHFYNERN